MPALFVKVEVLPEHTDIVEVNGITYSIRVVSLDKISLDFTQQKMEGEVTLFAVNSLNKDDFQRIDQAKFEIEGADFQLIFSDATTWSGEDAGPMSLERIVGTIFSLDHLKVATLWR